MTDDPYLIQSLRLQGFRAYLQPKTFDFTQQRCIAVFAPNGFGKSSIIDALEFMFSRDGTLERLGVKNVNNHAGPEALAHYLAEETKIAPSVAITFRKGKDLSNATRDAGHGKRSQPPSAKTVAECHAVSPIVRGHILRDFVEDKTPEDRYALVATWLNLGPLVNVQKNLRELRKQLKAAAEDTTDSTYVNRQLGKETANAITAWNAATILEHVNATVIAPLDNEHAMTTVDTSDAVYISFAERAKHEELKLGLAGLRQLRETAASLHDRAIDEKTNEATTSGAIHLFETSAAALLKAANVEFEERKKAATSAFQAVWKAAERLFAEGEPIPEVCPICATPLADSKSRDATGVRVHLAHNLERLADYAAAKNTLDTNTKIADMAHQKLEAALPVLQTLLGDQFASLSAALTVYRSAVEAWSHDEVPDSEPLIASLEPLMGDVDRQIAEIEAKQGEHTYAKAKAKIDRLLALQIEYVLAARTQAELVALSQSLGSQATMISGEIRKKVQALLDSLQGPMNDIYRKIQGAKAAPIRLELPKEDEVNQQRLSLVVDFKKNRVGVQPAGYLSDSQIHSAALALRMAAIKQLNRKAPIMALDDIVTSYDADHRRAIASTIATTFGDCQLIITTHDERFFLYLKDQLEPKDWHFTRITRLDDNFGPRFTDHKVSDDMIEARWNEGESAANEMRQAEEEWLLSVCRDFGVSVMIRAVEKAYSYERGELASALASALKDAKLLPKTVAGVNNRFMDSLQRGVIENFGSHFQEGPFGDGSVGDERVRWEEFKAFRSQFACPNCKRTKFKRPHDLKKPVCANEGCETQFEFVAAELGRSAETV